MHTAQIKLSWEIAVSLARPEEIGVTMYKTFLGSAAEIASMFDMPVEVIGGKFAQVRSLV